MAYATVIHVESYQPARAPFTPNSRPSATQVVQIIDDVSAQIDAALELAGYESPATASAAQGVLRAVCAKCAAYAVENVAPTTEENSLRYYREMCVEAMAMVAAGQVPGLEKSGGEGRVRWRPDLATGPLFTRDMCL